jgi:hypothetical protein
LQARGQVGHLADDFRRSGIAGIGLATDHHQPSGNSDATLQRGGKARVQTPYPVEQLDTGADGVGCIILVGVWIAKIASTPSPMNLAKKPCVER